MLYRDDVSRDFGVVHLNVEAMKALSDTITLAQRHELAAEDAALTNWLSQGGLQAGIPIPACAATQTRSKYVYYEHLKIAAAFELHLKARLLHKNYVLHKLDHRDAAYKSLAKDQRDRPIDRSEVFLIQPYHFDGRENYLPGLTEVSLKFSWLTSSPAYRLALGLGTQQLDVVEYYRILRNQVHFPGDGPVIPATLAIPSSLTEFLVAFVDSEIVVPTNRLISKHAFNFKLLTPSRG